MNKNYKKGVMALSQIFILVIGIVAISYALGSEVRVVSSQGECTGTTKDTEPRNEGGDIVFCYYHTDYDSSKKFTVTGDVNIKSSDGTTYQKYGNEWKYITSGGATGTVSSNRRDWIELANEALGKYINLKASVTTANDFCIKYEINGQNKYEVYTRQFTNSRDTKALANPKFYYIAKTSSNHIATDLNNIAYLWKGSNWVKLENQVGTKFESMITNKVCDASLFEKKEITNVEDKSDESDTIGSGGIPADYNALIAQLGAEIMSQGIGEVGQRVDTVRIGPSGGTRAVWQRAEDGQKWTCIENCIITGEMSNPNLCPNANCKGQTRNLCTHYYKSYLLREGYTDPPGNCDKTYFLLNADKGEKDSDGDSVPDKYDAFPNDPSKWRETDEKKTTEEKKKNETAPFGLEKSFLGAWGYLFGHMAEGVAWAAGIYTGVKLIGGFFGGDENLVNAAAEALMVGTFVGKSAIGAIQTGAKLLGKTVPAVKDIAWWGIGVGFAVTLWQFRYETQEAIIFECEPWKANTGGQHCNDCNNQGLLSCSEYQCKSLGQSCDIINKGTDKEQCAWINKNDVDFPIIEAWEEALISTDYIYGLQTTGISPPDRGVTIDYTLSTTGCVQAFTPLSFGITLDEPASCKLDTLRKDNFDDMSFSFSGGLSLKEHSYTLSLPGSGGNVSIENDGEYSIYVRCQDANGNSNPANFVFNFCVQQGPDTTPPIIETTYPLNNMPFAFEQESIYMEAYVNEPVDGCRWSHLDEDYTLMEDVMDCTDGNSLDDMNAQGLYTCSAELDGLNDRVKNNFYIRCNDLAGNINEESYVYTLQGTQPLVIDWVKPETGEVIKGSTDAVQVTLEARTSVGYKEGESNCYYKLSSETEDRYVLFYGDEGYSNYEHSQDLWLAEGDYEYDIKCVDLGGNEDVEAVSFSVESDADAPMIVRAYHEEVYLKLITNEAARCAYDTKYENYPCDYNFEDGTPMTTIEDINHYADWNTETTFYVKCEDEFGNQPWPDGCSIIVRPSELIR